MNWERGSFRLWVLGSAVYVAVIAGFQWSRLITALGCLLRFYVGPWCAYWRLSDYAVAFGSVLLPPVLVLGLGRALIWVGVGFRG